MVRAWALLLTGTLGCETTAVVGFNTGGLLADRCGADTVLAACSEAPCVVRDLGAVEPGAIAIGVDDDSLFFQPSRRTIARRALSGGEPVVLADVEFLQSIAVDGDHVYWTIPHGVIHRLPKHGGDPEVVATPFGNPTELVIDARHAYTVMPNQGVIVMADKDTGALEQLSGYASPRALALDTTHVYWLEQGTGDLDGALHRARLGDLTSAERVIGALDAPMVLAVGERTIAWANRGTVTRLDKASGVTRQVFDELENPEAIAVYGETIYVGSEVGWFEISAQDDARRIDTRAVSAMTLACSGVYAHGWYEGELLHYGR